MWWDFVEYLYCFGIGLTITKSAIDLLIFSCFIRKFAKA